LAGAFGFSHFLLRSGKYLFLLFYLVFAPLAPVAPLFSAILLKIEGLEDFNIR